MMKYRIHTSTNQLQLFRSTRFRDHYQEQDLEEWLEQEPAVLSDGELSSS